MQYKGYKIEKSGSNYAVKTPHGERWQELAANVKTAQKWIDADLIEKRQRQSH